MSKGKRYDGEQKLNLKKVFAVLLAIAVIVMFVVGINRLFNTRSATEEKTVALRYFPVYTEGKWGVIDSRGNIIIQPEYDEYIVVPDSSKAIFICTVDANYENNTYDTRVLNANGEELFTEYDLVEAIENYDSSNNLWYETDILKVSQDGKWGIINTDGRVIVAPEYDSIEALKGVRNSLLTEKDNHYGIMDHTGSVIIENNYKEIRPISAQYENGYIVINDENQYGVINYNKSVAVENKYDEVKPVYGNGNYYIAREGEDWRIVNTEGQEYLAGTYDNIFSIQGENAVVEQNNKYGLVSITDNRQLLEMNYDSITYATGNNYIVSREGKYGVMNAEGNTLVEPQYTNIVYRASANIYEATKEDYTSDLMDANLQVQLSNVIVSEVNETNGYIKVRQDDKDRYYNFRFEERTNREILTTNTLFLSQNEEGKYGFVDRNGNVVVNYIYDDAREQNDYGYASVKQNGLWGAIDSTGNVAVTPSLSLENNILVEFIGKWHLGEDLNLYYFTDET